MDTDRVKAWVASLGDHPHVPVLHALMHEAGRVGDDLEEARRAAATLRAQLDDLTVRHSEVVADADRLAAHIVAHPAGDYQTVLEAHDRTRR